MSLELARYYGTIAGWSWLHDFSLTSFAVGIVSRESNCENLQTSKLKGRLHIPLA